MVYRFSSRLSLLSAGSTTLPWYWCSPTAASTLSSTPANIASSRTASNVSCPNWHQTNSSHKFMLPPFPKRDKIKMSSPDNDTRSFWQVFVFFWINIGTTWLWALNWWVVIREVRLFSKFDILVYSSIFIAYSSSHFCLNVTLHYGIHMITSWVLTVAFLRLNTTVAFLSVKAIVFNVF